MDTETMKKHAFIIQVHKQPNLFGRIINRLSKSNHYFFVNVDAKTADYDRYREAVKDIDNVYFLKPRHNVHHGGISQIHCTLRLLNFVRAILPDYDFIHSISGQDYPLRSNELFDEYFEHGDKGYMLFDSEVLVQKWRDNKYAERVNCFYPNNRASLLSKIYYRISLDKIVNRFIKRDTICDLWGGGVGLPGLL